MFIAHMLLLTYLCVSTSELMYSHNYVQYMKGSEHTSRLALLCIQLGWARVCILSHLHESKQEAEDATH